MQLLRNCHEVPEVSKFHVLRSPFVGATRLRYGRRGRIRVALVELPSRHPGEDLGELGARADVELAEDLVKVVFDRARTDEEARADLGVREAITGESCNLGLLGGEVFAGLDAALAGTLTSGKQFARGAPGESLETHRGEHPVCLAQLLTRVNAAALAAQPFAVEEMRASEFDAHMGAAESLDGLAVKALGGIALAEQRSRARFDSQRPLSATG